MLLLSLSFSINAVTLLCKVSLCSCLSLSSSSWAFCCCLASSFSEIESIVAMFFICIRDRLLLMLPMCLTELAGLTESGGADIDRLCSTSSDPWMWYWDLLEYDLLPSNVSMPLRCISELLCSPISFIAMPTVALGSQTFTIMTRLCSFISESVLCRSILWVYLYCLSNTFSFCCRSLSSFWFSTLRFLCRTSYLLKLWSIMQSLDRDNEFLVHFFNFFFKFKQRIWFSYLICVLRPPSESRVIQCCLLLRVSQCV